MWQKHFQSALHHGKRTVGAMWNHAVKIAGDIDKGFGVAKRLYGALHPMIEDIGGKHVNKAIMGGFQKFDQAKADTMSGYNMVESLQNRIRKNIPEIAL